MPIATWYCTHPGERVFDPADGDPLPEPDRCCHEECKPTGPVTKLDTEREIDGEQDFTLTLADFRRLDIKPGQILVVRVGHVPAQADIERIIEHFGRLLPDNKVIVTASDVDLVVLNPQDLTSDLLGLPPQ